MSLKRCFYKIIRVFLANWTVFAVVGFLFFVFSLRLAFFTPSKKPLYHSRDEDYQDVPRHHVPHHPRHGDIDDEDLGEPITHRDSSTPAEAANKAPEIRRVFVSSGKIYENKTTTPFLIDGMDWRIAAWEYFVHFQGVNNSRLILFWTPWYSDDSWKLHMRRNDGPVLRLGTPDRSGNYEDARTCYLGTDRTQVNDASVVVFHGHGLETSLEVMPERHPSNQYWIYYEIEPPKHIMALPDSTWGRRLNDFGFNWTWSYSHLADVSHRFGRFEKRKTKLSKNEETAIVDKIRKKLANFQKREFDALMIAHTCQSESNREGLVTKLKEYGVKVDMLGRCYNAYSPEMVIENIGAEALFSKYRFVFAFELSRCDDYVTDRAYRAFNVSKHYSVIPVVYGAGKTYSHFLPEGSYINADLFASAKDLAAHLKDLAKAPFSELESYFMWQRDFELNMRYMRTSIRELCEKIWKLDEQAVPNSKKAVVSDVASTFGRCYSYSTKWLGLIEDTPTKTTKT